MPGRAGSRRGHGRRRKDAGAQTRAAWAMPRPVERASASDGCDDREKRQSDLSVLGVIVTGVNATSHAAEVVRASGGEETFISRGWLPIHKS